MLSERLLIPKNIDKNNAFALWFYDLDELVSERLNKHLVTHGLSSGIVIGSYLFFQSSEDRDTALEELTNYEGSILSGIGGLAGVVYCGQPVWSDYGSASDYYRVHVE